MGKTKIKGEDHNLFWPVEDMVGEQFEGYIYDVLLKELEIEIDNRNVAIEKTNKTGDNGKDIIIEANNEIEFFGVRFGSKINSTIKIYIEIKSVNSRILNDKEYFVNVSKNFNSNINFYVLLTNAKVLPNAYHYVENQFNNGNKQFVLMDQSIIAPYLSNYKDLFGNVPVYSGANKICVEYMTFNSDEDPEDIYRIYFLFRNYDKSTKEFKLQLATNSNWNLLNDINIFLIEPNRSLSKMVKVRKLPNNGTDDLSFNLNYDNSLLTIDLKNVAKEEFITKFVGQDRKAQIEFFVNCIKNGEHLYCVWGEAGIGKSRFIEELLKELSKKNYIKSFDLKTDNKKTVDEIAKFLEIKEFDNTNINDLLSSYNNTYRQRVIVIDNFHNANENFLKQIKKYSTSVNDLITLILIGRTDYTVGTLKYYEFIQWSKTEKDALKAIFLKKLDSDTCDELINSIIIDIPSDALKILKKNSDGNPLFITQYIEYLLDKKMIYIANRNSVGITDINSFYSKKDLPTSISDLYCCRFNLLKELYKKDDFYNILMIFAFYDGEIQETILKNILRIDNTMLDFLEQKGLVFYDSNLNDGSYKLVHESLLNYLRAANNNENKLFVSSFILSKKQEYLKSFSDYELGRLYLWKNEKDNAIIKFQSIIDTLDNVKNISNINIDMGIYNYLDDLYEVLAENKSFENILVSLLKIKVYITLHHLSPYYAVVLCDKYLELVKKSNLLKKNRELKFSLKTEKAHGLLTSGENLKGERLLIELQSEWISQNNENYSKDLFDVFDRLCAINIKFGCLKTAKNFNDLSLETAEKNNDISLKTISYRTQSKLYYLNSKNECLGSLDKVDSIVALKDNPRIALNNRIYRNIYNITYNIKDIDVIINDLNDCINTARANDFNRGHIQSYEVLVGALIKKSDESSLKMALDFIDRAINMSITLGISSFEWQLYNFKAIIYTKFNEPLAKIKECFDTAYEILENQNLLYIGERTLSYSNIFVIRNTLQFYAKNIDEDEFYRLYNKITYICNDDFIFQHPNQKRREHIELKTHLYESIKNNKEILSNISKVINLYDKDSGYFLAFT